MRAFLSALSIAAGAVVAHAALSPTIAATTRPGLLPLPAAACAALLSQTVAPDGAPLRRLDQLPSGLVEHAVLRSVNGCPVREVRYQGRTFYVGPSIPEMKPATPEGQAAR